MSTEPLTRAVNSSDLEEKEYVVDLDRVAAMSAGNRLGSLLFRFGPGVQPAWGRPIVLILARRISRRHRMGDGIAQRIAACALLEFAHPACTVCKGTRELLGAQLKVTCHVCEGTGLRRYSNGSRRAQIGSYGALIDRVMAECHESMGRSLGSFLSATSRKLGSDRDG